LKWGFDTLPPLHITLNLLMLSVLIRT
jgi:hypothetical protein